MKVLIVSEPGMNGVFRYVEALIAFLWEHEVEVHLAYSDHRCGDDLYNLVRKVQGRGGRAENLHITNQPSLQDFKAMRQLKRLVHEVDPDVIHAHSSKAGVLARVVTLQERGPVCFYHPHAYFGMAKASASKNLLYDLIETACGRIGYTFACSSDEYKFARDHLRLPKGKVETANNGVDTARFRPASAAQKRQIRREIGVPEDALILGTLGRSSAQKDLSTLYEAFTRAKLPHSGREVLLLHVGEGPEDEQLAERAARPDLAGRVLRLPYMADTVRFYQMIDGFALTSRYEGFSIALLEALASNLPIVVSEAPGNSEICRLPLSHCGHAAIGDIESFARLIEDCLADRLTSPNHRQVICARFEQRRCLARVLKSYTHALWAKRREYDPIRLPPEPETLRA